MFAVLLVLPCLLGSLSAYLADLAAILMLPILLTRGALGDVRRQPAMLIFVGAWALVLVNALLTMRVPNDLIYSFNFGPMLLAVPVFVVARDRFGRTTLQALAWCCLAGTAVALGVGLVETANALNRAAGWASNPNIFARLAVLLGTLSVAGVFLFGDWRRLLFLAGPVFGLVAAILSESRGALLAVPPLALVLAITAYLAVPARYKLAVAGAGLVVVILGAAGLMLMVGSRAANILQVIVSAFTAGSGADNSTQIRLDMYRAGFAALADSPWLGYGWANIVTAAAAHAPTPEFAAALPRFRHLHSDIVDFAVGTGIPGIVAWLLLVLAPIVGVLAATRDALFRVRLFAAVVLSIAVLAFGLTDMTLGYDILTTSFALFTAIVLGSLELPRVRGATRT